MSKGTYKFNEIAQSHPLLQTDNIDDVLNYWPTRVNTYLLAQRLPLVEEDTDKIEVDLTKQPRGGVTPMVSMGAEAPVRDLEHGRGKREFEAVSFREKHVLKPGDIYDLRSIGTKDELASAVRFMRARTMDLERRLLNRLELSRKQALFNGQVSGQLADTGQTVTVGYEHPNYLEPTASTKFDNYSSAEPILFLEDVLDDYRVDTGRTVDDIILPHNLMQHLIKSQRFRDLAKQNLDTFNGGKEEVKRLMTDVIGLGPIQVSQDFINFETDLTSSATSGDTTIDLDSVDRLSTGMKVYLTDEAAQVRERKEVSSISGNTVTLSSSLNNDFSVGAPVKYKEPTIPEDRIIMFGSFDDDIERGATLEEGDLDGMDANRWGEVVSTRSHYADPDDPEPGVYSKPLDKTEDDPPRVEQIIGIRALPRIVQNEAYVTPTVL